MCPSAVDSPSPVAPFRYIPGGAAGAAEESGCRAARIQGARVETAGREAAHARARLVRRGRPRRTVASTKCRGPRAAGAPETVCIWRSGMASPLRCSASDAADPQRSGWKGRDRPSPRRIAPLLLGSRAGFGAGDHDHGGDRDRSLLPGIRRQARRTASARSRCAGRAARVLALSRGVAAKEPGAMSPVIAMDKTRPNTRDDAGLVADLLAGDEEAFTALVRRRH